MATVGVARAAKPYVRIIDCVSGFTRATLQEMRDDPAIGIGGIAIYLGEADAAAKRDSAFALGMFVVPVTFSRAPGWDPTQENGAADGAADVQHAQAIGVAETVHLHTDLEGVKVGVTAQATVTYLDDRSRPQSSARYGAGLYVGDQQPCNGVELGGLALVTSYWKALSRLTLFGTPAGMVVEPTVGWDIEQMAYPNGAREFVFHGVSVDMDIIHPDWKGRTPIVWYPE